MALTAKKVYAILQRQINDMEAALNHPVRYKGTVASAELLPLNPQIGDMYNIESKSIYGEAGMNVAWNGVIWDTMGAPIDMSLFLKATDIPEWSKQPFKPEYTAEEVGALPADTKIPSNTSDLNNDSGFLTEIPDIYLTKKEAEEEYQPAGDYPTKKEVKEGYQPKDNYLTEQKANETYQPTGNYLENVPQATSETLGGIKASVKTTKETVEAKIDPESGKMYVPELPGSEDLSKEETAQKILTKLQEVIPLIEQVASNGIASSVNGFSFIYGTDGSVTMTYTPDGSSEAETALLPTGTTQTKIAQATKEIAASLKIIAGKDNEA